MAYYTCKSYKLDFSSFKIFELLSRQKNCFFLDSSLNSNYSCGRYSFLGADPFLILEAEDEKIFQKLRETLRLYNIALPSHDLPFLGMAVGYLAYDLGLTLEKKITVRPKQELGVPNGYFGFYNSLIIVDHFKKLFYICSSGFPEKRYQLAKLLAQKNFRKTLQLLRGINAIKKAKVKEKTKIEGIKFESSFSKKDYLDTVKKAKRYIKAGDIYQVNLSQEFRLKSALSSLKVYRHLRQISPSYFSAYLDTAKFQILSSSPERFLRLKGDTVTTVPMKGTRRRSDNKIEDARLKEELLRSEKDKAELMMIVDLERNDLGRVCDYDSVRVKTLRDIEKYSTVYQTTATVCGRLHKDKDPIDLLRACFPGGSITGCPKIRAMEIIEELEPHRRSIYTGCLGYLSFSGEMDFNILIRTILKRGDQLYFGVGGGIVADSRPEDEYEETLVKARAMMEAISTRD